MFPLPTPSHNGIDAAKYSKNRHHTGPENSQTLANPLDNAGLRPIASATGRAGEKAAGED